MFTPASLPPDVVLRNYFHAKDENRPHLLDSVFTEDAVLEIRNATSTISFPAVTSGREAIADVLVRSFGQTYENVYSFYLQRPCGPLRSFECEWIVAMTQKSSQNVRVGCGLYEWEFDLDAPNLARRLAISIVEMQVFPPTVASAALSCLAALTYPWSSPVEIKKAAFAYPQFEPVFQHVGNGESDAPRSS
jgi:hypothetical protein